MLSLHENLIRTLHLDKRMGCKEIAQQLGCGNTTVHRFLRRLGINRSNGEAQRKYQFDQSFFEHIDTYEKAQILGLWYADGCVWTSNTGQHVSSICLAAQDVLYLERVRQALKHESPLKFGKSKNIHRQDTYKLPLHSAKTCDDLIRLGCTHRKSLTLQFPTLKQVPEEFLPSFMLGYFEGDGSLAITHCPRSSPDSITGTFSITSTLEMCQQYGQILKDQCRVNFSIKKAKRTTSTNTYYMVVSGNRQVLKVMSFLYSKAVFRMERKWLKYQEVKQSVERSCERRKSEPIELFGQSPVLLDDPQGSNLDLSVYPSTQTLPLTQS